MFYEGIVMTILVVSDLHCGSTVGLMHPDDYSLNSVQQYLYDKWSQMATAVGHVDTLIVNGDAVDGPNKAEEALGLTTPDMSEQCEIVHSLLSMIDYDNALFINGSDYHTKVNPSCDWVASRVCGAEWGKYQKIINVDDIKMHIRHFAIFNSNKWQRTSSQRKEAYEMEHDGWDIDIYIRSHTHSFDYSGNSQNLTINTPCWKGRDAYIEKRKMERTDIGYITIDINGPNYTWDQMIHHVPERLYEYL
mgnify:CR=1 FL=1